MFRIVGTSSDIFGNVQSLREIVGKLRKSPEIPVIRRGKSYEFDTEKVGRYTDEGYDS